MELSATLDAHKATLIRPLELARLAHHADRRHPRKRLNTVGEKPQAAALLFCRSRTDTKYVGNKT